MSPVLTNHVAVKMHRLLDYDGNLPAYVHISDGKTADNKGAYDIPLLKNSVIVADRFYNDFSLLNVWASRFGEFSFGLNPVIESPMYDILFDEKIYGSNHLTLGKDYEIAPNGNSSNIHWDLVCIGANVYLDGELVRKGRHFVTNDLKGLNPDQLL